MGARRRATSAERTRTFTNGRTSGRCDRANRGGQPSNCSHRMPVMGGGKAMEPSGLFGRRHNFPIDKSGSSCIIAAVGALGLLSERLWQAPSVFHCLRNVAACEHTPAQNEPTAGRGVGRRKAFGFRGLHRSARPAQPRRTTRAKPRRPRGKATGVAPRWDSGAFWGPMRERGLPPRGYHCSGVEVAGGRTLRLRGWSVPVAARPACRARRASGPSRPGTTTRRGRRGCRGGPLTARRPWRGPAVCRGTAGR